MYEADPLSITRPIGRSIYATLVPFPIACFVLAFLTDLAYWRTDSVLWETFSVWLLVLGLIVAGFAVVGGLVDLVRSRSRSRSRRVRRLGQPWQTVLCQFVAVGLAFFNVFVHSRDGYTAVVPQGLILSALTVLVLLLGGVAGRPRVARLRSGGIA